MEQMIPYIVGALIAFGGVIVGFLICYIPFNRETKRMEKENG